MNLITRLLAFAFCIALAFSAAVTSPTFSSPTKTSGLTLVSGNANGATLLITSAGWVFGDWIAITSTTNIYWSTVMTSTFTSWIGVGLVVVGNNNGGTTCTTSGPASASVTTLVGTIASGCAADFATYYNVATTSVTSSTSKISAAVAVGTSVRWTLSAPATTSTQSIGISYATATSGYGYTTGSDTSVVGVNTTPTSPTATSIQQATASNNNFAFYVETSGTGSALVCFQTDSQHKSGICSGTHFSVAISGLIAMIALIFFN